jgi:cobyric acid synthase
MVQGASSRAGKSLLTTAPCRHFARRGVSVHGLFERLAGVAA